jgi:16S rRNA (adenine1518-N6/adenine1519-N6)-dimethyltransferase
MKTHVANPQRMRDLIRRHEFRVKKRLGQHFMVSSRVLEMIVELAEIGNTDRVLEIGPGLGSLTQYLAESAYEVVAVEVDAALIPLLEETMQEFPNTRLVEGDILKLDLDQVMRREDLNNGEETDVVCTYKVVGNLPYYITSPIVMGILEGGYHNIENLVIMIQKEVAQRMVALPATKEYGLLSVGVQYYAEVFLGGIVNRDAFWPQPEIESALVKLVPRKEPAVKVVNQDFFFWVARAAFGQRRKTLTNALIGAPGVNSLKRDVVEKTLLNLGFDLRRRGETLSLEEFAEVSNNLYPFCR